MKEETQIIPFVARPRRKKDLTIYQKVLLNIVIPVSMSGETVTIDEVVSIYTKFGISQTNIRNGVACRYSWDLRDEKGDRVGGYVPLRKNKLEIQAIEYFMRHLGKMIVLGYLTVIPKIDLKELT